MTKRYIGVLRPILSAVFVLFASTLYAADNPAAQSSSQWNWGELQLGAGLGIQGGGSSFSGFLRYDPEYQFQIGRKENFFGAGFDLSLTGFNDVGRPNFLVMEYGGFGSYHLDTHWDLRIFLGGQTWTDGQGTALFFGPQLMYHFSSESRASIIDGLVASYDAVLHSNFASLMNLGIVFQLSPPEKAPSAAGNQPAQTAPIASKDSPPSRTPGQEEELKRQQKDLASVVDVKRTDNGLLVNLKGDTSFKAGSAELSESGKQTVGQTGDILAKYPDSKIRIEGHSDSSGRKTKNIKLSLQRAENVKRIFVEHGVKAENISTKGLGSQRPVASNDTAEGRATNRRVEIYIDNQEKSSSANLTNEQMKHH